MRNASRVSCVARGIATAVVFTVGVPWPAVSAQDQKQSSQAEPVNFSLRLFEGIIERDVEQALRAAQQELSDLAQSLEAAHVIERCNLQALEDHLQELLDLYGRAIALRGTIDREMNETYKQGEQIRQSVVEAEQSYHDLHRKQLWPGITQADVERLRDQARSDLDYLEGLRPRLDEALREQQDLGETVRAKLNDLISEFLRRCCGKEACGDSSRPSTGDSSGRPGDSGGRSSGETGRPGGPRDVGRSGGTSDAWRPAGDAGPRTASLPIGGDAPGQTADEPSARLIGQPSRSRPATTPQPAPTGQPPTTTEPPPTPPPKPTETSGRPPKEAGPRIATDIPSCCEACPGTAYYRLYVPIEPDTDCQPGDVRRDDLSVEAGTCANPLTETPTPEVFANAPATYGPACCAGKKDQVLYDSAKSGGVNSEVGAALRTACEEDPCAGKVDPKSGTPMRLETSVLSSGSDTHGRNWVPENPTLKVGKERLKPCETEPFYVTKEATVNPVPAIMAAIGHEADAQRAQEAKGTACTASQSEASHPAKKKDSPQERAAKTAAIGLLTSQAKGQLEGLRATFDVTGKEDQLNDAKLQADLVNEVTQQKQRLNVPVKFEAPDAVSGQ